MKRQSVYTILCLYWFAFFSGTTAQTVQAIVRDFISSYRQLSIPDFVYDYREYFATIPDDGALQKQETFFRRTEQKLAALHGIVLSISDKITLEHLGYEVRNNLERVRLERDWVKDGKHIPAGGLYELRDRRAWYMLFAKKFTSLELSPEIVDELGKSEVSRVKTLISGIRQQTGFGDSLSFNEHLQDSTFWIRDKQELVKGFLQIDSIVRQHLAAFAGAVTIPQVYPIEWPDANAFTPPGMYVVRQNNAFG
jgi:hypothetical protein